MPANWRALAIVALLLAAHCALLAYALRRNFVTVDEVGHIPAGLSHWRTGTFSAYRVNPPLPRMIAALPLLAAGAACDHRRLSESPTARSEWFLGEDFIAANKERYFDLVCLARLTTMGWSVLAALIIFAWSRDLFGPAAGVLAVALWCFDPTVLAFAQVVTPDLPATAAGVAATYAFWRYLQAPSLRLMLVSGLLLGVAQLTKFTMLTLYGIWPLMWWLALPQASAQSPRRRSAMLTHLLAMFGLSWFMVNLGYGFRGVGRPLGEFEFVSRLLAGAHGNRFVGSPLAALPVPIPSDYLSGIDVQRGDFESGLPSYLCGEWRHRGWWYYYLYAIAVKTPLGSLVLAALAVGVALVSGLARAPARAAWTILIAPLTILAVVSSQTGFSHHLRYVLPAFPFVMINTGRLANWGKPGRRFVRLFVLIVLAWSIVSSLAVYPHSMSYFNELAGGPERGHDHLVNSNIDWGQDLLYLKAWLDRHPDARPLGLAYFNNRIDPRIVGIEFELPPTGPNGLFPNDANYQSQFGPKPGYYAVSVNFLRGMPFAAPDGHGGNRLIPPNAFTYFQSVRPIARAGYSIYIYRIDPPGSQSPRARNVNFP